VIYGVPSLERLGSSGKSDNKPIEAKENTDGRDYISGKAECGAADSGARSDNACDNAVEAGR
jgi:hypothetical protein